MAEQLPTSGALWRKPREEGVPVALPSGHVALIRPVALDVLLRSGKIPDLLSPLAAKSLWQDTTFEELGQAADLAQGMADLVNLVCQAAFLSPRIVEAPQAEDEIALDDVTFGDKMLVFQAATAGARALERFRPGQSTDVAPVHDGEGEQQPAE